jgi:hypothetical protein
LTIQQKSQSARFVSELRIPLLGYLAFTLSLGITVPQDTPPLSVFQATGFVFAALLASYFAWLNLELNRQKRRDELWERRYKFYKELEEWWLSTGDGASESGPRSPDSLAKIQFAERSEFLFGPEIQEHIISLDERGHMGPPSAVSTEFKAPFFHYLRTWDT